jgi:hypothetical protein
VNVVHSLYGSEFWLNRHKFQKFHSLGAASLSWVAHVG